MITVGPFYDKTDGVTIETALTITNERITLTADTDAGSAPTNILDNITGATSGTANDLNYITGNDAGMMQLELAAADVNRNGRMFLSITDAANHVPVFHELMVLDATVFDALVQGSGTAVLSADVTKILGTAVSAPATAGILDVNVKNIDNDAASASGTVTFPNATLASTVNITAAAGIAVSSLGTDVISAASISAAAVAKINAMVNDTADSGTTTTMVDAARTEADTDYWKGALIQFTSGTISGQVRLITGFNAATDTITFAPATTQAVGTNTYNIIPAGRADVQLVLGAVINALISGRVDANTQALANDVITAAAIANAAIDAATFAASAIDATAIATGAITAAKFAAGAIDASAIATDAIGSAEFAQAAADKMWLSAARTLTTTSGVKKNTALSAFEFFMRDSTDHVSGKTGVDTTNERSIDGGAFAACTNAETEVANGIYKIDLSAADLNGTVITFKFTGTGADPTFITIKTEG
jgi:hypothetical protein